MKQEIERKFLVSDDGWRGRAIPELYRQGYIARAQDRAVRVRIAGNRGELAIKIRRNPGLTRDEYEYSIPLEDAKSLLGSIPPGEVLEKYRYTFVENGLTWEVDEFLGANAGLIIAEVELDSEDQPIVYPPWLGKEVSRISRYFNAELAQQPYTSWKDDIEN